MLSDIAASLSAKELGNAAFKAGDFPTSVGHYTSAILADPGNPTFYLNRAAAYLKLGKYKDAERDSSSTLSIQGDNVKALFRRGQARMSLGNFGGSQDDLWRALELEPNNPSVKEELQKVQALVLEHAKRSKSTHPASSLPKPRTRRIPIEIIGTPQTTSGQGDLLIPVSSRSLDRPLPATSSTNVAPVSDPEDLKNEQRKPQSAYCETKQTRSTKYGGGIFRSSGSHTMFHSEATSAPRRSPQTDKFPRPAVNLASFTSSWNTLTTNKRKWILLQQLPPASLSHFFGSSLEADILSSMLCVLFTALSSSESEQSLVKEYMVSLPLVPRFLLIYTFLCHDDKNRAKEIWKLLDGVGATSQKDGDSKKSWGV